MVSKIILDSLKWFKEMWLVGEKKKKNKKTADL